MLLRLLQHKLCYFKRHTNHYECDIQTKVLHSEYEMTPSSVAFNRTHVSQSIKLSRNTENLLNMKWLYLKWLFADRSSFSSNLNLLQIQLNSFQNTFHHIIHILRDILIPGFWPLFRFRFGFGLPTFWALYAQFGNLTPIFGVYKL